MNTENKNMRLYEFNDSRLKKRIKGAIDKLDDSRPEDEKILQYLKSNLFVGNIQTALDTSSLKTKVRPAAYDWFVSTLETLKVPLEDKIHLLKLLENPANLIPAATYQSNSKTNLLSKIGAKIRANSAYQAIIGPLWKFKIGGPTGMGPGELALIIFSEDAQESRGKKGGDFTTGGWAVELKSGGVIPPGDSGKKVVDGLNNNLWAIAKKEGFYSNLTISTLNPSMEGGWFPEFFKFYSEIKGDKPAKALFYDYIKKVYDPITSKFANSVYDNLGKPGTNRMFAPMIFNMYKASHEWNSIVLTPGDENSEALIAVDAEGIPTDAKIRLVLRQEGNTYAVADGSMFIGKAAVEKVSKAGAKKVTKSKTKTNVVNPAQQELPIDNVDATQDIEHKQSLIQAEKDLAIKLQDPVNPIKQVWDTVDTDVKSDAHDDILSAISAGKSDQEVAQVLKDYVYEHSLKRMKQLID